MTSTTPQTPQQRNKIPMMQLIFFDSFLTYMTFAEHKQHLLKIAASIDTLHQFYKWWHGSNQTAQVVHQQMESQEWQPWFRKREFFAKLEMVQFIGMFNEMV